ncbi:MAG TPA: 50S ribosomal protein L10 [Thermoleophilaceae bacterium]|nr:50S ribosomal protein L10 [Thermoleophilaceae bacterium]
MNRDEKAAVIDQVADQIQESQAIFAVDYRGITVSQVAALRATLRDADATLRVVKNTLTERAADKAGAEDLKAFLDGPTAFTFVKGDAALAAKALAAFRREHDLLDFKGGRMDGAVVSADEILAISRLPSRDVLHGQLVGVLAHPISGLARTLNQLIQGLAVQLGQIAEQGLVGGDAPAAEPPADEPAAEEPAAEEAQADESAAAADEAPAEEPEAAADEPETTDEAEAPSADAEPAADGAAADNDQNDAPSEGDQEKES